MRESIQRTRESLAGSLLLAHPVLRDPNFRRTAILMSTPWDRRRDGSRPQPSAGQAPRRTQGRDFALGPLAAGPPLHGAARSRPSSSSSRPGRAVPSGFQLHFGIDPDQAVQMLCGGVDAGCGPSSGYSGWSAGQLENELKCGTWIVANPPADLFDPRRRKGFGASALERGRRVAPDGGRARGAGEELS